MQRNEGMHALRGIAAMCVYLQHLNWLTNTVSPGRTVFNHLNFGTAGVFIFFGLSGMLMAAKTADGHALRFMFARARRIFPGLWLALIISAAIYWYLSGQVSLDPRLFFLLPTDALMFSYVPYWTLVYEL